jgi:short-subunit dehydrogenase
MDIKGKVAVITGASEGIGAACAKAFQNKGALLSLNALASEAELSAVGGPKAVVTSGDCADEAVQKAIIAKTVERFGRVDILVNNAGIGLYAPSLKTPMPLAKRMFDTNVFAPVGMAQAALPELQKQGSGYIVNICSVGAYASLPWSPFYCASKYAIDALSEGMRRELMGTGIGVLTVYPGIVATRFREHVLYGAAPDRVSGIQRVITPDDLAASIVKGVEANAKSVVNPFLGHFFRMMNRMTPWLMDWYLHRLDK